MRYAFGNFELDTVKKTLVCGRSRVQARAKVIALLADLIQHRARLVYKGELDRRLWPDVVVGSTSLSTLVGEARSLIGDSGSRQSIIQTEPGRGYRFIASVRPLEEPALLANFRFFDSSILFQANPGALAALEETLTRLEHGCPRPLLVTGSPGSGKRQFVNELVSISQGRGLAAYVGRSPGGTEMPDLAPWIEILRSLLGNTREADLPPLIASDLLDLASCQPAYMERLASERTSGFSGLRFRLMDSLCRLFSHTAKKNPFVLILEDLQSVDRDSLALYEKIFGYVGEAPIALMGTVCPTGLLHENPNSEALRRLHASRDLGHIDLTDPSGLKSPGGKDSRSNPGFKESGNPNQPSVEPAHSFGNRTPVPPMPQ